MISPSPGPRAPRPWIVIAGGGTAGHVLPALSVATELVSRGLPVESIAFVGSARGIEARLVPEAGFAVTLLPGRGIQRKISAQNIASLWGLIRAGAMATSQLARRRPAVVLSVGGYASVPCVLAATVLRIPLVVAEQNARAGVANRLAARFARATAVSFPDVNLPRSVLTGNPVRAELVTLAGEDRATRRGRAREMLGIDADATVLLVFGGSLGARTLNTATCAMVSLISDSQPSPLQKLFVHHVSGQGEFATVAAWEAQWRQQHHEGSVSYHLVSYENRMDLAMAAADVCLCRSGASSVADLAILGVPALLVPLPIAAEDHQTLNAQAVAHDGAGVVISDVELSGQRLVHELTKLLATPTRLIDMAAAQQLRARPGAAGAVADLVAVHAARPFPSVALTQRNSDERS